MACVVNCILLSQVVDLVVSIEVVVIELLLETNTAQSLIILLELDLVFLAHLFSLGPRQNPTVVRAPLRNEGRH